MGKERVKDPLPTRNSNRGGNKKDQERNVGRNTSNENVSPSIRNKTQRHLPQPPAGARSTPQQKSNNNRASSSPSTVSSRIPTTVKVNQQISSSHPSERLMPDGKNTNMSQDNNVPKEHGGVKDLPGSNAEMWASVMSKLDSMQRQQNEALQEIKEEIRVTNSGLGKIFLSFVMT